ncbi:hypothetical protein JANAI62_20340 [Jannaschia pagri]|uniref:Uncharacterized protein n=1 Tax=Jannaschia pagri TaxID=2829797 RepID=A0ABQ4NLX2_9RHOB|nr:MULTISPECIES: hypothetical protein [unclassified Jannaschia]GIT91577.1 hypothetical protein JANAI61_20350 [Jannaschia sp. AI_61]GIT95411.1 hypothetical protein JANAI62_20340 [Jannaschia sp. AI_62]
MSLWHIIISAVVFATLYHVVARSIGGRAHSIRNTAVALGVYLCVMFVLR